jgi:hypothetical protein
MASGCTSCPTDPESNGGSVFCRHMHGVLFEQNPQPPVGISSRREEFDDNVEEKEDVKSISIGYCWAGGAGEVDLLRFVPCEDDGDNS